MTLLTNSSTPEVNQATHDPTESPQRGDHGRRRATVIRRRLRMARPRFGVGSQLGLASLTAALMLTTYSLPAYAEDTPVEATVAAGAEQQSMAQQELRAEAAEVQAFDEADAQTLTVSADAAPTEIVPDTYSVTLPPPPPVKKAAPKKAASAASRGGAGVIWPVGAGTRLSSGFGPRSSPCGGCSSDHRGLDMTPGAGTPIRATAAGVVSETGSSSGGYGVYAIIDHVVGGQKVSSLYAHMRSGSLAVSRGQSVSAGQQIGRVGSTGASTGAHLHFEIRIGGAQVDPLAWLRAND